MKVQIWWYLFSGHFHGCMWSQALPATFIQLVWFCSPSLIWVRIKEHLNVLILNQFLYRTISVETGIPG